MIPRIKAAIDVQMPPLMFILEDPTHLTWTRWDVVLTTAYEVNRAMVNGEGIPYHWDKSDRVVFDTEIVTSKSRAAVERREKKMGESKSENFGKTIIAVPRTVDGGPLPTLEEYLEEQRLRKAMMAGKIRVGGQFSNDDWKPGS